MSNTRRRAFTLIELLVVVAIIALLISILLPSLTQARDAARTAKCAVQLHSLGTGVITYGTQENDWIPGVNTSGANFKLELMLADDDLPSLRSGRNPTQMFDWMSPGLRGDVDLGSNRAKRMQKLFNRYACPSSEGYWVDNYYGNGLNACADKADFLALSAQGWIPISYLMPAYFQWWGQKQKGIVIASGTSETGLIKTVQAAAADPNWTVLVQSYYSRIGLLGDPARKVMAADGMRYLDEDGIDFDPNPLTPLFGSFTSSGAWWCGETSYGVRQGSVNWDGQVVSAGPDPPAKGRNLTISYRHNRPSTDEPTDCASNRGSINAMFFDGHVARLNDRQSREIVYWYPRGAVVQDPGEGMTNVPAGWEIP